MNTLFPPGALVRVRDDCPELNGPVHIRTPHYLRGVDGAVVKSLGAFPNPEDLAFGRAAKTIPLYHVAFDPQEVWPGETSADELLVEIFEHWLEPRRVHS